MSVSDEQLERSGLVQCWCGAIGRPEELFANDIPRTCGGSGLLYCECGGDFCVCHNHGSIQCDGCSDCEPDDDQYDWYDDDDRWDTPEARNRLAEIAEQEIQMWKQYESKKAGETDG